MANNYIMVSTLAIALCCNYKVLLPMSIAGRPLDSLSFSTLQEKQKILDITTKIDANIQQLASLISTYTRLIKSQEVLSQQLSLTNIPPDTLQKQRKINSEIEIKTKENINSLLNTILSQLQSLQDNEIKLLWVSLGNDGQENKAHDFYNKLICLFQNTNQPLLEDEIKKEQKTAVRFKNNAQQLLRLVAWVFKQLSSATPK